MLQCQVGLSYYKLQRPYISFSSPLLLILRQEITAAAVALFFLRGWRLDPVDFE